MLRHENRSGRETAQHSVHPTGGSLRVFRHFVWLGVGSVKVALSRPTHQRVTPAVGQPVLQNYGVFFLWGLAFVAWQCHFSKSRFQGSGF
jgi:hypothetical protein